MAYRYKNQYSQEEAARIIAEQEAYLAAHDNHTCSGTCVQKKKDIHETIRQIQKRTK